MTIERSENAGMVRPALLLASVAALILVIDQATKVWIVWELDLARRLEIDVLPPFVNLKMAWNTGINFGLPLGGPAVLIAVAVTISAALTWWILRRGNMVLAGAGGLVVGGALGNALDRFFYGAVADFLNMSCCGIENPYAFNVADIAIFVGAILIALKA